MGKGRRFVRACRDVVELVEDLGTDRQVATILESLEEVQGPNSPVGPRRVGGIDQDIRINHFLGRSGRPGHTVPLSWGKEALRTGCLSSIGQVGAHPPRVALRLGLAL